MTKTEENAIVQARYDELMAIGRHGHYETMFKVVREAVLRERAACLEIVYKHAWGQAPQMIAAAIRARSLSDLDSLAGIQGVGL